MLQAISASILKKRYLNFLSSQEVQSEPFYNKLGQLKNFYLPICEKIYQDNTEEAVAKNVFGSPTYICNDELFWGQDRLDFLERALNKS